MTAIKKLIDGNGNQYFPQTHTKAVVDDNGYSVESKMQAVQDVVNQAQMAIGAVPSDLTPTENSTNWVTSGGVAAALDELSNELYNTTSLNVSYGGDYSWILGTIHSDDGKAYSSSSYYHINIPVEAGMRMKITANQNIYTPYTFLKDINFSYNGDGTDISSHYCGGYSNVIRIEAGESAAFTIPEDCNYLYITCGQTSGNVCAPESVVVYSPKLDIAQETGQSTEKVMSQKAVTEELEVLGDNLIDMSVMGADSTGTSYLTATKDTENNGVIFNVVRHYNSSPFGRIYQMHLIAGKTYILSFEYLNTAYQTSPGFRNSSNTFIASDISSVMIPVNNEYKAWECTFVAPANAYYLGFANLANGSANTSLTIKNFSCVEISSLKESIAELDNKIEEVREENVVEEQVTLPESITYGITNAGGWNMDSSYSHLQIPIEAGRKYKVVANASKYTRVWLCTGASTPASGGSIPLCSGTSVTIIEAGNTAYIDAHATAHYIYTDADASNNNYGSPQEVCIYTDFEELNKEVGNIKDSVATIGEDVFEGTNIMSDVIDIPYYDTKAVKATDGTLNTVEDFGHSNYIPTNGASAIYVYAPTMYSSIYGLAFYYCRRQGSYISGHVFSYPKTGGSVWVKIDVPQGANFFRTTIRYNTVGKYRIVAPTENLMDIFKDAAASMIGTQIMRNATPISGKNYIYAFGINQTSIIGSKAYVSYSANEHTLNGDAVGYPNVGCLAIVDLFDFSVETIYPVDGTKQYANGTDASNAVLGYATSCPTPQGNIGYFGLMRFNNKNPYYCHSMLDVGSIPSLEPVDGKKHPVKNWTSCLLSYNGNTVDFSLNNYRQMLVDMGYMSTYIAGSNNDYVDNINIHYNKEENIYYAVLCGAAATNSQSLPLVLMQSTDLATWSPKAYLGKTVDAGEIAAIYKNGIAYVVYRRMSENGIWYVVYDVTNDTELSSGRFPVSKELLTKPDCFEFDNNIYMACNIDPSVYGDLLYYNSYYADARQEIAIYKVMNGVPKFFRRVNNPTGLNYYSFMETPPMYATQSSTTPMYAQGAIYVAFSEDRRHLYMRQFAQISFADVTALFADFGRIF